MEGLGVEVFPGVGEVELEQYTAHADPYDGADFEQLQADRIHLRLGPGGADSLTGTGFNVSGITLPLTIAAGQTATLNLEFTPTVAGQWRAA